MYLNYIMSSLLEIVKCWFQAQFRMLVLLQRSGASVETNDNGTVPIETRNCRWAITDAKKKTVWDYYFDPANKKPIHKHVQEWFLQEFWHLPLQSTISEMLFPNFAHSDSDISQPSLKKQRYAQ